MVTYKNEKSDSNKKDKRKSKETTSQSNSNEESESRNDDALALVRFVELWQSWVELELENINSDTDDNNTDD